MPTTRIEDVRRESDRAAMPVSANVLESIDGTPFVQLRKVVPSGSARIVVKLEGTNPTGNMKDRMANAARQTA
jgi:cysteine synthase